MEAEQSINDNGANSCIGMHAMKKRILNAFLATVILGLLLVGTMQFRPVQASTSVTGIISSDTSWTRANSPYRLTGPVGIEKDVTLNIEPGVQVYFDDHYMQVNGTLVARGSDNAPLSFLTGEGHTSEIIFKPSSKNWDEKTGTGSIIENGNIPSNSFKITINSASPKIAATYSQALITINGGSPLIVNNRFSGHITIKNGTPIISNNIIIDSRVIVENGSPKILNNTMQASPTCVEVTGGNPHILNNDITGFSVGISATSGIIERNYIHGGPVGIEIGDGVVRNNTIQSGKGILVQVSSKPAISYNNIPFATVGESGGISLTEGANQVVNAADNWWGTTDEAAISESIFDSRKDFSLGTVNFVPFLTEPNPMAMPDPNIIIPNLNGSSSSNTSSPSENPQASTPDHSVKQNTPETDLYGIAVAAIILATAIALFAVGIVLLNRKKP